MIEGVKMKKNGFTLIEVLATITLIAALALVLVPTIINQVNSSKNKVDEKTNELIYQSAYNYIDLNPNMYPMQAGNVYCIKLKTLTDNKFLKEPVMNHATGKEYDLNKFVEVSFETDIDLNYNIVSTCTEVKN